MADLIVITFDNEEEAGKVRETIRSVQREGLVSLNDSAVVVKDEDGQIHVKNELDRGVKVGFAGGGLVGLFIGFLFGGPIGSLLLGMAGGAAVGSLADLGLQKNFVTEVSEALTPGSSALFIIIRDESNPNVVMAALRPYKGEVHHTSLAPEAEEAVRSVLKKRL